jgi:hypothetical protein
MTAKMWTRLAIGLATLVTAGAASAQIMLFEQDNFAGRSFAASNSVANLNDTGFNDRASSMIVRSGRWQICVDAYFGGRCETLGPGEYTSLRTMGFNNKISSVRELGWTPDGSGGWGQGNRPGDNNWGGSGGWGSGSRAILYEDMGLKGRTFAIDASGVPNLRRTGFNNTASSLRIESGYWIFCSEADYQGECRTFGPGDHKSMPSGFNDRISSGRRLSSNYPYRNDPNWGP